MTAIIEFLFGHKTQEWTQGVFSFEAPVGLGEIVGGIAFIMVVMWALYRIATIRVAPKLKIFLILLKSGALTVLFLCLLSPRLTTSSVVPLETHIGLLVDNSSSMTIRDIQGDRSRAEVMKDFIYGEHGIIDSLPEHFKLHSFGFDRRAYSISGPNDLSFSGSRTFVARSMEQVAETTKGLGLSALVLVTDGGDNGSDDPIPITSVLKAQDIPLYVIGTGGNEALKDLEIMRVKTTGSVMEGAITEVQVWVRSQGYEDQESELLIEEGDRVVVSKKIRNGPGNGVKRYTLKLTPEREGLLVYTIRIPEEKDELITENNRLSFLVDNQRKQVEILYIEGHPRNEYKFIRRAVEVDKSLRLVTYLRTGPQKFLRQGIESPTELSRGYPTQKEELYRYEAIIFGDIPNDFFSPEQLAMTREFVSKRGGGFLMIGGATAFDEGFIGTPIDDLLPVTLVRQEALPPQLRGGVRKGDHPTGKKFTLRLTPEGERSPLLRLGVEDEANRQLWREMPQLQGINVTGRVKPGATVLAVHPTLEYQGMPLPVIAHERYGRGRTMAITTATIWRWQMLMPHDDNSHERFWRQVLRWLAADAPSPVEILHGQDQYSVGDNVKVRVKVSSERYEPVNNGTVWLKITDPTKAVQDLRMERSIEEDGVYVGAFGVAKPGVYHLEVSSTNDTGQMCEASTSFLVAGSHLEYRNATLNTGLLKEMAQASGGKFYTSETANDLAKDLKQLQKVRRVDASLDFWDMPVVFLFLLLCLSLEWLTRRRKGLA